MTRYLPSSRWETRVCLVMLFQEGHSIHCASTNSCGSKLIRNITNASTIKCVICKSSIKKIPVALYLSFLRSKGALYLSFIRIKGYIYVYILHICCWATKYNTIFLRCCYLTNQFVFFASQRRLKIFSTVVIRNSRLSVKFQNCS